MLFSGLLRRGLPILAGLGIADVLAKIGIMDKIPAAIPRPDPVYPEATGGERLKKLVTLAAFAAVALTIVSFVLRKMKIRLPF
jgi:hypothetical protein